MFKLQLFLQKSFFRLVMLAALFLFLGVFVYAVHLEKFNVPPEDMRVPFGDQSAKPQVAGSGTQTSPLAIQSLSSAEVSMQLTELIADALSFNKDNYKSSSASMQKYFTDEGFGQYTAFLTNAGFETTLQEQNLQSGAYVEQPPIELTHGVYNGVYKWVFEVPVTISFIPRDAETYKNDAIKAQNRRFLLRAQFARVQDVDPSAVKIELWQILPPRSAN